VFGVISKELVALVEFVAENGHDAWAEKMMSEGWTPGDKLDAVKLYVGSVLLLCVRCMFSGADTAISISHRTEPILAYDPSTSCLHRRKT